MEITSFAEPSYEGYKLGDTLRCINFAPIKTPVGWRLVSTDGFSAFATVGSDTGADGARLAIVDDSSSYLYAVIEDDVYFIGEGGSVLDIATLNTSQGRICAAVGAGYILLVDGVDGWVIDAAAFTCTRITDGNFPANPTSACFVNGRFYVSENDAFGAPTGFYYRSQLLDPLDWTPSEFGGGESLSDPIISLASDGEHLYLIGSKSFEIHSDTGDGFERISGSTKKIGTRSKHSVAVGFSYIVFAGSPNAGRGSVWAVGVGGLKKISTCEIEKKLAPYGEDCFGFLFTEDDGRVCYCITTHAAAWPFTPVETYVYDFSTEKWHRRTSGAQTYWDVSWIVNCYETIATTSKVRAFRATSNACLYYGQGINDSTITRLKEFGPLKPEKDISIREMRVSVEAKHDSSASYTLTLLLQWSDNRGLSWNAGMSQSKAITSGTTAQLVEFRWSNLGLTNDRIWRISSTTGSVSLVAENPVIELEKGRH